MMKLFPGLGAVTLASFMVAPAQAGFTHSQVEQFVEAMPLTAKLRDFGARVKVVASCENKSYKAYFTFGRFPSVTICADDIHDLGDLQKAMNHESVHMAQWCHGNDSIWPVEAHKKYAKEKGFLQDADFAHKRASQYEPEEYDSEFEAYFYQMEPEETIIGFLADCCKEE